MTTSHATESHIRAGSIVVGVDGSHHGEQALAWAAEEARLQERPLTIVHAERALGAYDRGWLAQAGIPPSQVTADVRKDSEELIHRAHTLAAVTAPSIEIEVALRVGDARDVLLALANRASMVVLGSRGRGPVASLLLGSVSVALSRQAACPVVVLRPREDRARPHGVLVGTDGSGRSMTTLETAFREASYHGLPLTVVHCRWEALAGPGGWRTVGASDPIHDDAQIRVAEVLAGLREKFPDVDVKVNVTAGHVDQCVADLSRAHELTVIGRHAHTLLERVGSFSLTTAIVEHACGPVLIVP
jgi:nucleotide-binding universal stress UspA family protein